MSSASSRSPGTSLAEGLTARTYVVIPGGVLPLSAEAARDEQAWPDSTAARAIGRLTAPTATGAVTRR